MQPKLGLILASGRDVPEICPAFPEPPLVVCANGGAALARKWNLKPALIVGDQDSLAPQDRLFWQAQEVPFLKHPAGEDYTDLELAVDYCLEQGIEDFTLVGGWGSRIDHSLGSVALLYCLARQGWPNRLLTRDSSLTAFCAEFKARVRPGSTVSLLPLTKQAEQVESTGLLYPLQGRTLVRGSTLGISNKAVQEEIWLRCGRGVLLVVLNK